MYVCMYVQHSAANRPCSMEHQTPSRILPRLLLPSACLSLSPPRLSLTRYPCLSPSARPLCLFLAFLPSVCCAVLCAAVVSAVFRVW